MNCPYCEEELLYEDHYGLNLSMDSFNRTRPGYKKIGDIYRCDNEECEVYGEHFHVLVNTDEVREGYPC